MLPSDVTPQELHWLAGLLEGEGSFMVGPPSQPHLPLISVQMTDRDVMEHVGRLLGRKPCASPPKRSEWKPTHQLRVAGAPAVAWMRALRPLMSARRRTQIDRAIASYAPRDRTLLDDGRAAQALAQLATGSSVREVAERFGTSVWCIYDLRLGRTHKTLERPQLPRRGDAA